MASPITNPFARIMGSLPPLIPKPEPITLPPSGVSMPDDDSLPAFPSSRAPKVAKAPFNPDTATPEELAEQPLTARLRKDEAKDLNPWGTAQNHPGFWGKFGHALSVATGGPNRRQYEEMGLQKSLQDLLGSESRNDLEGAQTAEAKARTNAIENPPAKETQTKWKPIFGGNGQVVTAPNGNIVEADEQGNLRAIELPEGATVAPKEAPLPHDAFHEWLTDPQKFEEFLKAQTAGKATAAKGFGQFAGLYALRSVLQQAYTHNPALLPVLGQALTGALEKAGINLPANAADVLGAIPLDQPLSPVTNQPIGTSMPSAPTPGTRGQAQNAQKFIDEYPRISTEVESLGNNLGPVKGREVMGFLLGQVGSTGDPDADKKLNQLRTDLTFVGSNAARFHVNSVRQAELFDSLAASGKNTAPAIQGFLDAVHDWAETSAKQERGFGEQGKAAPAAKGKPDYIYVPGKGLVKQ